VEVKVVGCTDVTVDGDNEPPPLASFLDALLREVPDLDEEAETGGELVEGDALEDGGPRLWNSRYLALSLSIGLAPLFIPLR